MLINMTKREKVCGVVCILSLFLLMNCAGVQVKEEGKEPPAEPEEGLSLNEQEVKSIEKFNEILMVSRASKDRKAVLPRMEKLYSELISDYPEAPLAQESYWKLIEIYVEDYSPPEFDKAEELYKSFNTAYPASPLRGMVDRTIAVSLYRHKEWQRLLRLSTPFFSKYAESGEVRTPLFIFMYAEAHFNLGNYDEAEKGFRIVIEKFPQLNEDKRAQQRLDYIRRKR